MNFLFLCSSLEPGRDGVGDYTRRLAGELCRQGHSAKIVALHDRYLAEEQLIELQEDLGLPLETLRLSHRLAWKKRMKLAAVFVETFDPDWLSLQYVPFGYQDKGMPQRLGRRLKKLAKGRKWHLMFHELWVGMDYQATFQYQVWGQLQRQIIKDMIHCINPVLIHTHTPLYRQQLTKMGCQVKLLPLFGNIPIVSSAMNSKSMKLLPQRFVVFGGIHPGIPKLEFAQELAEYGRRISRPMTVVFAGRNGSEATSWINIFQREGIKVEVTGEQSPAYLSEVFMNSDVGIVTTPALLADKSGAVAALREHDLPLLCVAQSWDPRGVDKQALPKTVKSYCVGGLVNFLTNERIEKKESYNVKDIAGLLVNELEKSKTHIWLV